MYMRRHTATVHKEYNVKVSVVQSPHNRCLCLSVATIMHKVLKIGVFVLVWQRVTAKHTKGVWEGGGAW